MALNSPLGLPKTPLRIIPLKVFISESNYKGSSKNNSFNKQHEWNNYIASQDDSFEEDNTEMGV